MNGYRDRRHAGEVLGEALAAYVGHKALVLGVPRGGVVVAAVVAAAIDGELDLVVARKMGAPGNPELAIGAVAADGVPYVDRQLAQRLGVTDEWLAAEAERQVEEVHRREGAYRGDRAAVDPAGRVAIVVDDGVATGATLRVALASVRRQGPAELVCAVPVGPADTLARLAEEADSVVCPLRPHMFMAVGQWYVDFGQVSDEAMTRVMSQAQP